MSEQATNPNKLQAVFTRGGMSRRAFMRNAAALGLSLSAAQTLLAACAAPAPAGNAPAEEAPVASSEPKSGGAVTWGIESDVVNLIPFGGVSGANHWGKEGIYDSLL